MFLLSSTLALACSSGNSDPDPTSTEGQTLVETGLLPINLDCLSLQPGWPMFGQNVCGTRAAATGGLILPQTVSKLGLQWTFNAAGDISATPAVSLGEVYVPDWGGNIYRIDALTGKAVWSKSVAALVGLTDDAGPNPVDLTPPGGTEDAPAAVDARDTPAITPDSIIFGTGQGYINSQAAGYVVSLDRGTGALKWKTLVDPHAAAAVTSSPVVNGNVAYVGVSSGEEFFSVIPGYPCCSFRGSVVALNVQTGKILWQTPMIEDSVYLNNGALAGYAGDAVWSTPVVDRKRNQIYVTTGNNYTTPGGVISLPPGDHVESIVALDLNTGAIKWSQRMTTGDIWNVLEFVTAPSSVGPDDDFGAGANLFQARIGGKVRDVVGAGQKSGVYYALDPDTGTLLWKTQVGPGGHLGGIHWGTAVDANHIYVPINNGTGNPYVLGGSGPQAGTMATTGSWAALDPATGEIQWQTANPVPSVPFLDVNVNGPVTAVNGVVFGGSMDANGSMFALDGTTGKILWSFQSGATVYGGPAVADGVVYWGSGYGSARLQFGTPGKKLLAFRLKL
jgi:polyvinyl alcohol dehydrogenase (cytochrome)